MNAQDHLWNLDATGQAAAIKSGEIDASELVEAAITAAEASQGPLNAIAEPLYEAARKQAVQPDADAPFAGVPTVIKDLGVSINGVPIHSGSAIAARTSPWDSTLVHRLRTAGLVPIATATSSEWGLRIVTETDRFGITRNPWNTGHTTGGSSGGSAALVAGGVVSVAHASDGGGSIRIPACTTGLVGLKPSRGRVPMTPEQREGWGGMVANHMLTRSVRDSAAMLDALAGPDPLSPYEPCGGTNVNFAKAAAKTPGRLKIGVFDRNPLDLETHPEAQAALALAATACKDAGHDVENIDIPSVGRPMLRSFVRTVAANFAGLMRWEAARVGPYVSARLARQARLIQRFGDNLKGGEVTAAIGHLQEVAMGIISETEAYDVVLMPVLSGPPVAVNGLDPQGMDLLAEKVLDTLHLTRVLRIEGLLDKMLDNSLWSAPWPAIQNITGQPAIALPVHMTADGLPLGVQAVGRSGDEAGLLSLAAQLEADMGWQQRRAPFGKPA